MSNLRNSVQLIGRLGANPEIKEVSGNKKVARLRIANNEYFKKDDGSFSENTYWFNVVAWGNLAERIGKNFKKGHEILIDGKLTSRSYEDKDGNKKNATEVVAAQVLSMEKTSNAAESKAEEQPETVNEDLPF